MNILHHRAGTCTPKNHLDHLAQQCCSYHRLKVKDFICPILDTIGINNYALTTELRKLLENGQSPRQRGIFTSALSVSQKRQLVRYGQESATGNTAGSIFLAVSKLLSTLILGWTISSKEIEMSNPSKLDSICYRRLKAKDFARPTLKQKLITMIQQIRGAA